MIIELKIQYLVLPSFCNVIIFLKPTFKEEIVVMQTPIGLVNLNLSNKRREKKRTGERWKEGRGRCRTKVKYPLLKGDQNSLEHFKTFKNII